MNAYKKYPPEHGVNWGCLGTIMFWVIAIFIAIVIVRLVS